MQTSFIPKKSQERRKTKKKDFGGLFMGVGVAVFILMILTASTVFLYNRYLEGQIENMASILDREKGSLEKEIIKELDLVDKRIESDKKILEKHTILTTLFELLEQNTLQEVSFKEMAFYPEEEEWVISMSGTADSYATIALQSDVFGENKNISELIFSDLGVGLDGGVVFSVTARIDQKLISYRRSLE